jgi:lambda family phage tail tape measure protein
MANMIARLGVLLGIDSAEFVRGIDGATKKLEQFGDAAQNYGKVAATALTAAGIAALNYADQIVDVAKANDVAVGSVIKLRDALQDNGGEADNAAKMLSSFVGFVDKTADGNLAAQQTMARLGVSLKDIGNLSITELQDKFIKSLGNIQDPITRNALAMEIFGKAAKGVDFVGMADSMADTNALADKQAKAFQDAADVIGYFEKQTRDFAVTLVSELGPPLKDTIDYFDQLASKTNVFGSVFKVVFQTVFVVAANVAFVIKGIVTEIELLVKQTIALATFDFAKFKSLGEEGRKQAIANLAALQAFEFKVMGSPDGRKGLDDPRIPNEKKPDGPVRKTTTAVDPEAKRLAAEADREAKRIRENDIKVGELMNRQIDERLKAEQKLRDEEIKLGEIRNQTVGLNFKTNQQLAERQTLEDLSLDRQRTIFNYEQQTRLLQEKDKQLALDIFNIRAQQEDKIRSIQQETNLLEADREERIKNQNQLAEKAIELARERNRVMREMQEGDETKGFGKRAEEFFAFAPTAMENGAQMFDSLMGNMTSALNNFVSTGKLSFKDLTRSIIQDMIRIQLRAQMISLFSSMFNKAGPAAVSSYSETGGISESVFNPLARASGGPVNAGIPYMVGERGPEMIVPRSNGTVIPNNQLNSSMGSTTNVTNNYINAIDTKSFEDRLLGSSNAIWAANQYANKSLAVNRGRA